MNIKLMHTVDSLFRASNYSKLKIENYLKNDANKKQISKFEW